MSNYLTATTALTIVSDSTSGFEPLDVTIRGSLNDGAGNPLSSAKVTLTANGTEIGNALTGKDGNYTFTVKALEMGTYAFQTNYAGDGVHLASSSPTVQVKVSVTVGNLSADCFKKLLDMETDKISAALTDLEAPKPLFSVFNVAIGANTNMRSATTDYASKLKPAKVPCILRVYVCLSAAGIFSVQRILPTGTQVTEYMNQGVALTANAGYMFDVLVDTGEAIDFQTTVAATVLKLSVVEKDDAK